jgi:hypothetical protein
LCIGRARPIYRMELQLHPEYKVKFMWRDSFGLNDISLPLRIYIFFNLFFIYGMKTHIIGLTGRHMIGLTGRHMIGLI